MEELHNHLKNNGFKNHVKFVVYWQH